MYTGNIYIYKTEIILSLCVYFFWSEVTVTIFFNYEKNKHFSYLFIFFILE